MTTFKTIVKISKEIKDYVEKNHKLPKTVTIDKVTYTYPEAGYLISKSINNLNKEIKKIKVNEAPKLSGETVQLKLDDTEYKKLAKKLSNFITEKGRLPNYLTYNGKKIKQRVFIYSFAKIIVFYNTKGRLPGSCKFYTSETIAPTTKKSSSSSSKKSSTTKSKKKHGHATKSGCDNRGQNTSVFCACHSFQEVVRNLYNIVIPQKTLAAVMGTTSSGTDHNGIKTAVIWFNKKYNKNLVMTEKYFSDLGVNGINKIIKSDNQDCIIHLQYRKKWGHYEVVNSISGNTWNIQNSLGNKCSSGCYCGYVEPRSYADQKAYINAKTGVKSILVFTRK